MRFNETRVAESQRGVVIRIGDKYLLNANIDFFFGCEGFPQASVRASLTKLILEVSRLLVERAIYLASGANNAGTVFGAPARLRFFIGLKALNLRIAKHRKTIAVERTACKLQHPSVSFIDLHVWSVAMQWWPVVPQSDSRSENQPTTIEISVPIHCFCVKAPAYTRPADIGPCRKRISPYG